MLVENGFPTQLETNLTAWL